MNTTTPNSLDCLFCKIIKGDIPSVMVVQDENVFVFKDIYPKARIHYLIVPKRHIATLNALNFSDARDADLLVSIAATAQKIAKNEGFADFGYKLVNHCNAGGGQEVFHLHFHLLSDFLPGTPLNP